MVNITIRFPVTMSVVRRNGTTASYNYNQRGERYTRTINGFVSDQIRAIEANSAGLSYDELDARAYLKLSATLFAANRRALITLVPRNTTWKTKTTTTSP